MRVAFSGTVTCLALAWVLGGSGCGSASPGSREAHSGPKFFTAPPKPGASINASLKCECYACDPHDCCAGGDESTGDAGCAKGYDFTSCNMSVESCTSRCFQKVWRVPRGESCASRRPQECCAGG